MTSAPAHLQESLKLSADPLFADKVVDVAGLHHNPPERAVVLCVDEKSQIQALNRSQPVPPMMPGMPERRTHDYLRHGITSLFAAFNIAGGTVMPGGLFVAIQAMRLPADSYALIMRYQPAAFASAVREFVHGATGPEPAADTT
jgi:hypothetical protein